MAQRFYVNCPLAPGPFTLEGPEAHHLATVSRLRPGDAVCLFNGDGHDYPGTVRAVTRHAVALDVIGVETPRREVGLRLEVAAPLPKGDRAHFLLEKLTELGATAFVPLRTQRSIVHPREHKLEKLQRAVIEASKQCGRSILLQVGELTAWESYLARPDLPAVRLVAHPGGPAPASLGGQDCALAVGPEGGFTDEELVAVQRHSWQVVGLGPRLLRVETAALLLTSWAIAAQPFSPAP